MRYKHINERIAASINWGKFLEHREFIVNILNQVAGSPINKSVELVNNLGGADHIGKELHQIAQEIVTLYNEDK
jgi:hypothetical protein